MPQLLPLVPFALVLTSALQAADSLTPTPHGDTGIAASYPLDANIAKDPRVIFADGFEGDWQAHWLERSPRWRVNNVDTATGTDLAFTGTASAKLVLKAGQEYGSTLGSGKFPNGSESMHLRWYVKFSDNYLGGKLGTTTALDDKTWTPGASGVKPTGTDKANAMVVMQPKGLVEMYYYNLDQQGPWGASTAPNVGTAPVLANGVWHCIEIQSSMNTPGEKNCLMKLWINGELKGEWSDFRWRSDLSLQWNSWCFLIGRNEPAPEDQYALIDNVVVATEYIGPMASVAKNGPAIPRKHPKR